MANPSYTNNGNLTGFGAGWLAGPASPKAGSFFLGSLDEIAIYDKALSDARVIAHYQAAQSQAPQVLSMQSHVFGHGVW